MSFTPTIKALKASSTTITVQETTPTNGGSVTNGYGSVGGPANRTYIERIGLLLTQWGKTTQYLGLQLPSFNLDEIKFTGTFEDAVYSATVLLGVMHTDDYTINGNTIQLQYTGVNLANDLQNVTYYASEISNKVFKIKSVNTVSGLITFYENISELDGGFLYKMYEANTKALVLSCGITKINQQIKDMAISIKPCENSTDIMQMVLLKLAAQVEFNCGDYAESDKAAKLLCGTPNVFTPCSNC